MTRRCSIASISVHSDGPLTVIAGPCVLEEPQINETIGRTVKEICDRLGFQFIYKASFDKANRSSIGSPRGPGMRKGLAELQRLRSELGAPVTTDVHEPGQAAAAAAVVDLLQVPAFLCRQTELLLACAATEKPVNVKKGQFISPAEMAHVIRKLEDGGCENIMITERGTFFGYNRLVNDFIGLGDLMELGRPVCFDVTHSTQLPGAGAATTAGLPERAPLLLRAAVAAGVDAIFLECHPDPKNALSDASTMQPLEAMDDLLSQAAAVRSAVQSITPSSVASS